MLQPDVCIDTFFTEIPLAERVKQVASAGYSFVETWKSDKQVLKDLKSACQTHAVSLVGIVLNPPSNKKTSLTTPETHGCFLEAIDRYSDYALFAGCRMGIVCTGNAVQGVGLKQQKQNVIIGLQQAARIAEKKNFLLVLEALNTHIDHPGYFLDDPQIGFDIIKAIGSSQVKLLYDIYHMQIMDGNLIQTITNNIELIGHFHAAGVPGRHEISNGELNYRYIFDRIEKSGYKGFVGLEYIPALDSAESLRQAQGCLSCF